MEDNRKIIDIRTSKSLGFEVDYSENRDKIYSELENNLVTDNRCVEKNGTDIFERFKKPNSKTFSLSAVRFLNSQFVEKSPKYFATYKHYTSSYRRCFGDWWEINKLLKGNWQEVEELRTKQDSSKTSFNEHWAYFRCPRETIASVNTGTGTWYTSYDLTIQSEANDKEKDLLLLWDKIRGTYIPSDPNFPIEEAFWLSNIDEIRQKMWEKKGMGDRGYS